MGVPFGAREKGISQGKKLRREEEHERGASLDRTTSVDTGFAGMVSSHPDHDSMEVR
jgi:hypothetical protein